MPWDSDIDVQVSETTLHFMAKYYNMTEHHFELPDVPDGRTYLMEINPNFVARTREDRANVIDARWIDTSSGIFIDITAVRKDYEARDRGQEGALMCKDSHRFNVCLSYPYQTILSVKDQGNSVILIICRSMIYTPYETASSKA